MSKEEIIKALENIRQWYTKDMFEVIRHHELDKDLQKVIELIKESGTPSDFICHDEHYGVKGKCLTQCFGCKHEIR